MYATSKGGRDVAICMKKQPLRRIPQKQDRPAMPGDFISTN
jgi:hypothetical protein